MIPKDFFKTAKICEIENHLKNKGHFFVEGDQIISAKEVKGVSMKAVSEEGGIRAEMIVKKGQKIKEPLFFCFGVLTGKGEQFVAPKIIVEDEAEIHLIAHCSFPNARKVKHQMEGFFKVGKNAKFFYEEHHFHGNFSGANVLPRLKIEIDEGGYYQNNFNLTKGTVGKVEINLSAVLMKNAKIDFDTKVFGKTKSDDVSIVEKVFLLGENSRSLMKMRAVAKDGGKVLMQGETYARASGCLGHVDCQEIVIGKGSVARAVPIVEASNENARVTHEASVGKVNQKELETLMTRGLSEEEAIDLIVKAMLR